MGQRPCRAEKRRKKGAGAVGAGRQGTLTLGGGREGAEGERESERRGTKINQVEKGRAEGRKLETRKIKASQRAARGLKQDINKKKREDVKERKKRFTSREREGEVGQEKQE